MKPRALLAGVLAGASLGILVNALSPRYRWLGLLISDGAEPLGQVFLRLLFLLIIPLLFSALVVGIASIQPRDLGRLGARTLGYTVVVSLIAVAIGLTLVNLIQPGSGMTERMRSPSTTLRIAPTVAPVDASPQGIVATLIPDNPVKAAAQGDMLGVIVFALVIGIALALTPSPAAARVLEVLQGIYDICMTAIGGVFRLAPLGVGALVFTMTARLGWDLFLPVAAYVAVVLTGLALQLFVVYGLILRFLAGKSLGWFFRGTRLAMVTAFSTASSAATLPSALKVADENLKLPKSVSRFVLTAGATMNQNGTALFEGVTVLFLAQLYGIELGFAQQAFVMGISILAGVGTAGIPAGSLPVIAMILGVLGIPPEGLAVVLGVDRLLDMARTTLNVMGDLVAAVVLSRGVEDEG